METEKRFLISEENLRYLSRCECILKKLEDLGLDEWWGWNTLKWDEIDEESSGLARWAERSEIKVKGVQNDSY
jgi:hypothetical protein